MGKKKPSKPKPSKPTENNTGPAPGYGGPVPTAKCEPRCHITAFPHGDKAMSRGMTLRDYFAARAITGNCNWVATAEDLETTAAAAYRLADAMLAVRKL